METKDFTIGYVAKQINVSTKTLKNWEDKGLIKEARRNQWGHRVYNQNEIETLIETARKLVPNPNF